MSIQFNSEESDSRTRVFRPRTAESLKAPNDSATDKLADAIRKSWIQERSDGAASNKRA